MLQQIKLSILMLLTVLVMFGCASTPEELENLDIATRSYERFIRWGEFDRAKQFHIKDPVLEDLERRRLKFYRITGYNIIHHQNPDLKSAYIVVEIKYYKNERPVIKSITVKQKWEYDEKKKIWSITTPFPNFR